MCYIGYWWCVIKCKSGHVGRWALMNFVQSEGRLSSWVSIDQSYWTFHVGIHMLYMLMMMRVVTRGYFWTEFLEQNWPPKKVHFLVSKRPYFDLMVVPITIQGFNLPSYEPQYNHNIQYSCVTYDDVHRWSNIRQLKWPCEGTCGHFDQHSMST